jgi:hypothetical protein
MEAVKEKAKETAKEKAKEPVSPAADSTAKQKSRPTFSRLDNLGPRLLLPGELITDYDALVADIVKAVNPRDAIEDIWTRIAIDIFWEITRCRRFRRNIHQIRITEILKAILEKTMDEKKADEVIRNSRRHYAKSTNRLEQALRRDGWTMDEVTAEAYHKELDTMERIDHKIRSAQSQFNCTLREITRHRAEWGAALRQAIQDAEAADLAAIGSDQHKGIG